MSSNIILEGPDNSGKSTLAEYLSQHLQLPIQGSEGPPKYAGEIHDRLARYAKLRNYIFDRHPVVSQAIYGAFREGSDKPTEDETHEFYGSRPLIIYCRAKTLDGHVLKDHDTPDHMKMVEANNQAIIGLYDAWAAEHAHIIYRIGQSMYRMKSVVKAWY